MRCPNCPTKAPMQPCKEPTEQSAGCPAFRCLTCNLKIIVTNPSAIRPDRCQKCKGTGTVKKWPNGHPRGAYGYDYYIGGGGMSLPCECRKKSV